MKTTNSKHIFVAIIVSIVLMITIVPAYAYGDTSGNDEHIFTFEELAAMDNKTNSTHEMGHLLGLNDNPPIASNKSIMNYNRNRESIYVPQPFDIMNVKYIYGDT